MSGVAAERELMLLRTVLDEVGEGVVVLDGRGGIHWVTPRALELLVRAFGVAPEGALPGELGAWVPEVLRGGGASAEQVFDGVSTVLAARVIACGEEAVLGLRELPTQVRPTALRRLGLTEREAEVLACIARGRSVHDAAAHLGISRRTVHKHLEHVYEKLGVERRVEAIVRAYEAAAEFRAPPLGFPPT